jgi:hypothetical protein
VVDRSIRIVHSGQRILAPPETAAGNLEHVRKPIGGEFRMLTALLAGLGTVLSDVLGTVGALLGGLL